jgi:hypothetical protein
LHYYGQYKQQQQVVFKSVTKFENNAGQVPSLAIRANIIGRKAFRLNFCTLKVI